MRILINKYDYKNFKSVKDIKLILKIIIQNELGS